MTTYNELFREPTAFPIITPKKKEGLVTIAHVSQVYPAFSPLHERLRRLSAAAGSSSAWAAIISLRSAVHFGRTIDFAERLPLDALCLAFRLERRNSSAVDIARKTARPERRRFIQSRCHASGCGNL